jgi:tetratricopeptide (TPR) repeat protein
LVDSTIWAARPNSTLKLHEQIQYIHSNPARFLIDSMSDYRTLARSIAANCSDAVLKEAIGILLNVASNDTAREASRGAEFGRLLLQRGLLAEADDLFHTLALQFPQNPVGYVGLARSAMRAGAWERALEAWNVVNTQFSDPPKFSWISGRMRVLLKLGHLDEARNTCEKLAMNFPDRPDGLLGLAKVAMQEHRWTEACTHWTKLLQQFSDHATVSWHAGLAAALIELGSLYEAEKVYRELTLKSGADPTGFVGLAQVAMRGQRWIEACARWDEVLQRFRDQAVPGWRAARAIALMQLNCLDDAEQVFRDLAEEPSGQHLGFAGLARAAMQRKDWRQALGRWDETFARFAACADRSWNICRGETLLELGDLAKSEVTFRQLCRVDSNSIPAWNGLLRVLIASNKPEQALIELNLSPLSSCTSALIVDSKFEILTRLNRLGEAKTEYDRLLRETREPDVLRSLFEVSPRLHEGWRRTQAWLNLEKAVECLRTQNNPNWSRDLDVMRLRIKLALRDYESFIADVDRVVEPPDCGRHTESLRAMATRLREPLYPNPNKPKIFGIGLSKTGTSSLAAALKTLGFSTLDWMNPLTCELFSEDDLHLFDAFTDTPVTACMEFLYHLFPASKFVYTIRAIDDWEQSITDHVRRHFGYTDFAEAKKAMQRRDAFHHGLRFSNLHRSLYFNHGSYRDAFGAHDRRVKDFFRDKPSNRFLEFNIFAGQGWQELCAFTDDAVPVEPFPWSNRRPEKQLSHSAAEAPY